MAVGNFVNFHDFPTHESILPQSRLDFKYKILAELGVCYLSPLSVIHNVSTFGSL